MDAKLESREKTIELVLWIIGILGIALVMVNQNTVSGVGFLTKNYFPVILVLSMIFISLSLFLKINRDRKKRDFSVWNHSLQIIRTAGGLALAIYYLLL